MAANPSVPATTINGRIVGDVYADTLEVGASGAIEGKVFADIVILHGRINGSVRARSVQLRSTGRVEGDIFYRDLEIAFGARVEGNCKHIDAPYEPPSPPA